jgi:hypothetical protein
MAVSNRSKRTRRTLFSFSYGSDYATGGNKISLTDWIDAGNGCERIIEVAPQPEWLLARCLPTIQELSFRHRARLAGLNRSYT